MMKVVRGNHTPPKTEFIKFCQSVYKLPRKCIKLHLIEMEKDFGLKPKMQDLSPEPNTMKNQTVSKMSNEIGWRMYEASSRISESNSSAEVPGDRAGEAEPVGLARATENGRPRAHDAAATEGPPGLQIRICSKLKFEVI